MSVSSGQLPLRYIQGIKICKDLFREMRNNAEKLNWKGIPFSNYF